MPPSKAVLTPSTHRTEPTLHQHTVSLAASFGLPTLFSAPECHASSPSSEHSAAPCFPGALAVR
ncbi:hypothetical protein LEMLEM_LOCUS3769, partial [Lemmus lemmus]